MLIDLLSGDRDMTAEADVCVIGAGAAGIALVRDLQQYGRDVCLLEAGGLDFDRETQSLFAGRNIGRPYYDLDQARLRFFGGTTNIWGGRCVPLDRIDFERRDWIPHSGWPISRGDLDPWYRLAHKSLELGEFDYSAALWRKLGIEPMDFTEGELTTAFWRFDDMKERFNRHQCDDLVAARNVRIYLPQHPIGSSEVTAGAHAERARPAFHSGLRSD
jgi:choline dehydrogenase-like flavoprotein